MAKKDKIVVEKEWQTINVHLNDANIEADFNYETKKYYMSHGSNDMSVSFNAENGTAESIQKHIDRAKCVIATLEHIKKELGL